MSREAGGGEDRDLLLVRRSTQEEEQDNLFVYKLMDYLGDFIKREPQRKTSESCRTET